MHSVILLAVICGVVLSAPVQQDGHLETEMKQMQSDSRSKDQNISHEIKSAISLSQLALIDELLDELKSMDVYEQKAPAENFDNSLVKQLEDTKNEAKDLEIPSRLPERMYSKPSSLPTGKYAVDNDDELTDEQIVDQVVAYLKKMDRLDNEVTNDEKEKNEKVNQGKMEQQLVQDGAQKISPHKMTDIEFEKIRTTTPISPEVRKRQDEVPNPVLQPAKPVMYVLVRDDKTVEKAIKEEEEAEKALLKFFEGVGASLAVENVDADEVYPQELTLNGEGDVSIDHGADVVPAA